jgi:lysophospholipase L1-like esterase
MIMKKLFILSMLIAMFLLFNGSKDKPVKLFLIGDSTMADKPIDDNPERGWGMVLPSFFNDNVIIENHARNGRSSRTFIEEGRWDFVLGRIGEGDFVVLQFGHNDEVETKKAYTPLNEFKANFQRFVREVRGKGAEPILCTSVARRRFDSIGNLVDTHPVYPDAIRQVAMEMKVAFVDMEKKSEKVLEKYGIEPSKKLFMHIEAGIWKKIPDGRIDDTHFVNAGAMEMSKCFIEGIREENIKPLKKNLLKSKNIVQKYTTPVSGIDQIKPVK